jgi:hypothetical protein
MLVCSEGHMLTLTPALPRPLPLPLPLPLTLTSLTMLLCSEGRMTTSACSGWPWVIPHSSATAHLTWAPGRAKARARARAY